MGCDIHAHTEIKVDGEWLYFADNFITRNYTVFAKMAGVRNYDDIEPISEPRGLPDDISKMTRLHRDRWGVDGHSDSWLSFDEICELIDWLNVEMPEPRNRYYDWDSKWESVLLGETFYLFGNTLYYWKVYREDYPDFIEDIRLVFWFDC